MPFAGYKDFDDCVAKNQDKDDPKAYCGAIKHQVEDEQWTPVLSQGIPKSDVERAKAHFNISDAEWAELSDEEKQAYIDKLPPVGSKREARRHRDFSRIYDEFINYYKDVTKGESEYYSWLNALSLDETKGYAEAQESFHWAKNMLSYIREDDQYKYYKVLVGFPLQSMNGNVYKERDLIAAALTLKGLHPSLNHNNQWHFTPDSRWGEITTEDARFEDGAIEAIVKVSKNAICPICDGKPMTELIDSKRIVNVSLQGGCALQDFTGVCDGFQFDDKGFSLLTSDVLPGIPMARIFPLESIMVEALRTSSMTPRKGDKVKSKIKIRMKETTMKKRRIKLKPKIREQSDPAKMGQTKPLATGRDTYADSSVYKVPGQGTSLGPSGSTFRGTLRSVSQQTEVARGTDPAAAKPEGVWKTNITEPESSATYETTVGTPLTVKPSDQPDLLSPAEPMPEVDSHVGPSTTPSPSPDLTTSELPSSGEPAPEPPMEPTAPSTITPKPPHKCPAGHHWSDADGKCIADEVSLVDTVPAGGTSAPLGEQSEEPCPEGQHRNAEGNCVPDEPGATEQVTPTPPCPEGWHEVDGICVEEQAEEPCPDGYHRDEEGNCVPDEPLDERVRRIKAETKRFIAEAESDRLKDNMKKIETTWVMKYSQLNDELRKQRRYDGDQNRIIKELRAAVRNEQLRSEDIRVDLRDLKNQFADATRVSSKYARLVENLKIENEDLKRKYHGALHTNLELSKKVTKSNEDYLELAKVKEDLENKLTRARTNAKKTLKLRI